MQELVEVRLDAVPVLAQRHADVFRPYGIVQGALLLFELRETLCHRIADHALLDDLHEVRKALLHFPALRLQRLEIRGVIVALLVILRRIQSERRHVLLVVDDVVQGEQHHVLQVPLAGLVQVALLPALGGAIVVVIRPPSLARTGHALHGAPALTAIELAREPIARGVAAVHAVRPLGTLALVLGEPPLRAVESRLVDKDGHSAGDRDVAVVVLADVGAVLEHLVQHVHAELRVPRRAQALRVHLLGNGLQRLARRVFPKRPLHERRRVRVRDVLLRGPVHVVAEQLVAVVQGVLRVVVHAALDVLRQLAAVILRHGLHQPLDEDAFGSLRRDVLGQQANLASRVADFLLRHRQNVFVAPQAVGLPHDEGMGTDFCDFRQHLLEPRSCVRGAGYCRVLILLHDFEAVRIRPFVGKLALLVDARVVLRVGREAIVRYRKVVVVRRESLLTCHRFTTPCNFCL